MKNLFEFTPDDNTNITLPADIIKHQCDELANMSDQLIIGKVEEYDGHISDYKIGLPILTTSITDSLSAKTVPIQSELGELSGNKFTYEFFITSKNTTNFVYRVMFFRHGISIYPTRIVLDETIANQINLKCDFDCLDEKEFTNVLAAILNSQKFKDVINSLYSINKKAELQNAIEQF